MRVCTLVFLLSSQSNLCMVGLLKVVSIKRIEDTKQEVTFSILFSCDTNLKQASLISLCAFTYYKTLSTVNSWNEGTLILRMSYYKMHCFFLQRISLKYCRLQLLSIGRKICTLGIINEIMLELYS